MFDVFIFYIKRFFYQYIKDFFFKIFGGHPQWNSDITKAIKKLFGDTENGHKVEN